MTNHKAFKILDFKFNNSVQIHCPKRNRELIKAILVARIALQKQLAKPMVVSKGLYMCPECGQRIGLLVKSFPQFCRCCGQKLRDEKDEG